MFGGWLDAIIELRRREDLRNQFKMCSRSRLIGLQ
jgi:hypothetical protein